MKEFEYCLVSNKEALHMAFQAIRRLTTGEAHGVTEKEKIDLLMPIGTLETKIFQMLDGIVEGENSPG